MYYPILSASEETTRRSSFPQRIFSQTNEPLSFEPMQPVYIQRIASIHPQGNHSQENNPKVNDSLDVAANRPFLQACEPDYKDIIANATLRRRMSRIVKMGVACGLECMGELSPRKIGELSQPQGWAARLIRKSF